MKINTHRLLIREFTPADVVHIQRIASSEGFIFYNLDGGQQTSQAFVDRAIDLAQKTPRESFKLAVEDKSRPGHCIGYVALDDIGGHDDQTPDIGYLIDPREQRKGFATEAMMGLMNAVLGGHNGLEEIWLTVHPDNIASQRVAGHLSFQMVGEKQIKTMHGHEPRLVYRTDSQRFLSRVAEMDFVMG